jgi:YbbR domain-containing protein
MEYPGMATSAGKAGGDKNGPGRQNHRMSARWAAWVGNIGSLALAIVLALAVWVNATAAEDPDEVHSLEIPAPVTIRGLSAGLVATGGEHTSVRVTLRAPRSLWPGLQAGQVLVEADLSGKEEGAYTVPLTAIVEQHPVRIEKLEPDLLSLSVERLETRSLSVRAELSGQLAVGFSAGTPVLVPAHVTLSGPASFVDRVVDVVAPMSVTGLRSDASGTTQLVALDSTGQIVPSVKIQPESGMVFLPIAQQGGYRDFVVKAVIVGAVQNGFRLTGLAVTPSVVTLFSTDPSIVLGMAGYVETEPLDITGAKEDVVRRLSLKLPAGVTVVGDSTLEVNVSISAIEDSQKLTRKVSTKGLVAGLTVVSISPAMVDVIVAGPLDDLRKLQPSEVEVMLDLSGYGPGTYTLAPTVRIQRDNLREVSVSPIQVEIVLARTPAPA